jgi:kumamolisin
MPTMPAGYVKLKGSEQHPASNARLVGPADSDETFCVTIVLRRRLDGEPMPDFDYYAKVPPSRRPRLPEAEFAAKYGASPADIDAVTRWARAQDLTIVETSAARRAVIVSGTVAQMELTFGVTLGLYEVTASRGRRRHYDPKKHSVTETYRGRDGFIHLPKALASVIIGVFGFNSSATTQTHGVTVDTATDLPNTSHLNVPQVMRLYNFPTNPATGQTLAILAFPGYGYDPNDIERYFLTPPLSGFKEPMIIDVKIDGASNTASAYETTEGICIAATVAQGATIAVYFTPNTEDGWLHFLAHVLTPQEGELPCGVPPASVVSCTFLASVRDDGGACLNDIPGHPLTPQWFHAFDMYLEDMARQGVTFCVASGDAGARSCNDCNWQNVGFPASSPLVLACGGTTIDFSAGTFDECLWNVPSNRSDDPGGATGGGVSSRYPLPSYQCRAGVPASLYTKATGRGVPDVAANASLSSGYWIPLHTKEKKDSGFYTEGTSAAAPLIAGLITMLNAALCEAIGFLNPMLYTLGNRVCRDINPWIQDSADNNVRFDNEWGGVKGYPAGPGWDACTGWGVIDGSALLCTLREIYKHHGHEHQSCSRKLEHMAHDHCGSTTIVVRHDRPRCPFEIVLYEVPPEE